MAVIEIQPFKRDLIIANHAMQRTSDLQAAVAAGYRELAKAALKQALRDCRQAHDTELAEEAAAWLRTEEAREMAKFAGVI